MQINKINILIIALILCSTQINKGMVYSPEGSDILRKKAHENLDMSIMVSALNGNCLAAQNAIFEGANVNYKDNSYLTPLHRAVLNNHFNVAQLLISNKADINAKALIGQTPLIIAASKGNLEIVKLLLDNCADITATFNPLPNISADAIEIAESKNYPNVAKYIREYKANREQEIQSFTSPLIPDLVSIVEEYEGYKEPKTEVECEAE